MKFYRLSGAKLYYCIHTIYQFIKPYLDNKMSILEKYEALINKMLCQMHMFGLDYEDNQADLCAYVLKTSHRFIWCNAV